MYERYNVNLLDLEVENLILLNFAVTIVSCKNFTRETRTASHEQDDISARRIIISRLCLA